MSDPNTRRDLSKLRTVPLDDATHRRLRLYCHGLHEDGEAGEALARVAGEAVNAWIDAREGVPAHRSRAFAETIAGRPLTDAEMEDLRAGRRVAVAVRVNVDQQVGDPSEGEGELYGRWRR